MSTAGAGEEGGDLEKLCLKTSGRAAGNLNSGTFARIEKIKHNRGRDSLSWAFVKMGSFSWTFVEMGSISLSICIFIFSSGGKDTGKQLLTALC